ncbi:MotA/TolQ/ExbB proton channel family protein [Sphingomonas sp. S1-29]|uniref:motility protein A n=1 Tax=Sphingomonas sp. S1-29 TaxID=2991074 RepID=UPI00224043A1|nr:MotA/TolQ/ExbB proton channel family protein [Sphingomonas sp. S1-29]UZK68896.1 MotA/TolQ/ExbB proton channel family protein [Sphingomonas sp. S1-29]
MIDALAPFLDPLAAAIVGGGTLAACVLRFSLVNLARAAGALRVLPRAEHDAEPQLAQIAALGRIARKHGVMALDRSVIDDPDVALGIAQIVDGAGPDEVAAMLAHAREARIERHLGAAEIWSAAAEAAPAFGMIGTLIGLVRMFTAMQDPAAIGGAMAVALLATLYGALIANLVAAPIAGRLRRLARAEAFERARLEAPLVALAAREMPRRREIAA